MQKQQEWYWNDQECENQDIEIPIILRLSKNFNAAAMVVSEKLGLLMAFKFSLTAYILLQAIMGTSICISSVPDVLRIPYISCVDKVSNYNG